MRVSNRVHQSYDDYKILDVDFNAQAADGAVRLNTRGALESIKRYLKSAGGINRVVIDDGECSAYAQIEVRPEGLVAIITEGPCARQAPR